MKVFIALCLLTTVVTSPVEKRLQDKWSNAAGYEECPDWVDPAKPIPKPIKDICGVQLECAGYEDIANTNCGYGVRRIAAGKWVGTNVNLRKDNDFNEAFKRLVNYINLENAEGVRMNMTAPVVGKYYENWDKPIPSFKLTMHFFIPSSMSDPPAPTSDEVYLEDWDEATVYYRAQGKSFIDLKGWEVDEDVERLSTALKKANLGFYPNITVIAGFTDPRKGQQRSEIMVLGA